MFGNNFEKRVFMNLDRRNCWPKMSKNKIANETGLSHIKCTFQIEFRWWSWWIRINNAKENGNQDKYGQDKLLLDVGQFETQTLNNQ